MGLLEAVPGTGALRRFLPHLHLPLLGRSGGGLEESAARRRAGTGGAEAEQVQVSVALRDALLRLRPATFGQTSAGGASRQGQRSAHAPAMHAPAPQAVQLSAELPRPQAAQTASHLAGSAASKHSSTRFIPAQLHPIPPAPTPAPLPQVIGLGGGFTLNVASVEAAPEAPSLQVCACARACVCMYVCVCLGVV